MIVLEILFAVFLFVASMPLQNLAHELGHMIPARLFGIPVTKLVFFLDPSKPLPPTPRARLFGTDLYWGMSHLTCFIRLPLVALNRAPASAVIIIMLCGPLMGVLFSVGWMCYTSGYVRWVGAIYIIVHLINLIPTDGMDGVYIKNAWRNRIR